MQNIEKVRFNMIEQQIRPCDVLEVRILELLKQVRRELFVPEGKKELAFMDMEIPLGHGVSMWQPKLEAARCRSCISAATTRYWKWGRAAVI